MRPSDNSTRRPPGSAFTLVELLVVIVVIGLLASVILLIGTHVMHNQKVRVTEQTMRNVTMAIDVFKTENPLRNTYDVYVSSSQPRRFGPFPPYQLAGTGVPGSVDGALDPAAGRMRPLSNRLARDLGATLVQIHENDDTTNNDIRALYAYLRVHAEDALAQVPEQALKALRPTLAPEQLTLVTGSVPVEVLGIHDAWGVPLDYCLYVKLDYGVDKHGMVGWRITDRIPVLRSRGVSRETYEALLADGEAGDPQDWIFSEPFPTPAAGVDPDTGRILSNNPRGNGWARAVGEAEDYKYLP